jgi:hypothetical protein
MTSERFLAALRELVDENPFAIRAALRILSVDFTKAVPTLAVTTEARPRLLVNLAFVSRHCRDEDDVKAVVCHEFLHVLLRHTEDARPLDDARHLALDAVINAIIDRELEQGAAMMARYYAKERGPFRLLRPPTPAERKRCRRADAPAWARAWPRLYDGHLVVDDVEELARDLAVRVPVVSHLLGDHDSLGRRPEGALRDALEQALAQMNGTGIWRAPRDRGVGAAGYDAVFSGRDERLERWRRTTLEVLRRHLAPDPRARAAEERPREYRIPVLSAGDRRAFVRALWDPFLPEAAWNGTAPRRVGSAHVYLDVSGSMHAEMPHVVALLGRLSAHVRRPFWAFSDEVAPAVIERGQLRSRTTGGTSLSCVLAHLAATRPPAAVVVTDGYVEEVSPEDVRAATTRTRLHAIVTRDGNPAALRRAGIAYTQLEKVPA